MSWFRKKNKSTGKEELGDVEFDDINFSSGIDIIELEGVCDGSTSYLTYKKSGLDYLYLPLDTTMFIDMRAVGHEQTLGQVIIREARAIVSRKTTSVLKSIDETMFYYDGSMSLATCVFELDIPNNKIKLEVDDSAVRDVHWKVEMKIVEVTI